MAALCRICSAARAAVVVRAAAEEAEGDRRIRTRFSGRPKQVRAIAG